MFTEHFFVRVEVFEMRNGLICSQRDNASSLVYGVAQFLQLVDS